MDGNLSPMSPSENSLSPNFLGTDFLNNDNELRAILSLSPMSPRFLDDTPKKVRAGATEVHAQKEWKMGGEWG